jgi:cobalt/nickel transport system ATP-binding protein
MRSRILMMDEPTAGLDDAALERVTEILLGLPQAMLVVSHQHEFLRRLACRTRRLIEGRLIGAAGPAAP